MSDLLNQRARLQMLAERVRRMLLSGEIPDDTTMGDLERIIQIQSLYLQLVSVLLLIDQLETLAELNADFAEMSEDLYEDMVYFTPEQKMRALSNLSKTFKNVYETVQEMGVVREGSKNLLASLKELMRTIDDKGTEDIAAVLMKLGDEDKKKLVALLESVVREEGQ